MGVRQYVGARYVPQIIGEWNGQTVYEPLSVVTYNFGSYTSKKAVPAGVAPTNDEYWALTGQYNQQVEEYRQEVDRIKESINDVKKEPINNYANYKAIAIGDSYGDRTDGWPSFINDIIPTTNKCKSGALISGSNSYINQLKDVNWEGITHVYLASGTNDITSSQSYSNIYNGFKAIKQLLINQNKNIQLIITMAAGNRTENVQMWNYANMDQIYAQACGSLGIKYVSLHNLLSNTFLLNTDSIHPNIAGERLIAKALLAKTANADFRHTEYHFDCVKPAEGLTFTGNFSNYVYTETSVFGTGQITINCATPREFRNTSIGVMTGLFPKGRAASTTIVLSGGTIYIGEIFNNFNYMYLNIPGMPATQQLKLHNAILTFNNFL